MGRETVFRLRRAGTMTSSRIETGGCQRHSQGHQRINRFAPYHHHVFYSQRQVFLRHTVTAVRGRGTHGCMFHPRRQAEVRPRQGTEGRCVSSSMFNDDSLTCSPVQNIDYFKNDWTEGSKTPSDAPAKGTENVSIESQAGWSSLLTPSIPSPRRYRKRRSRLTETGRARP